MLFKIIKLFLIILLILQPFYFLNLNFATYWISITDPLNDWFGFFTLSVIITSLLVTLIVTFFAYYKIFADLFLNKNNTSI